MGRGTVGPGQGHPHGPPATLVLVALPEGAPLGPAHAHQATAPERAGCHGTHCHARRAPATQSGDVRQAPVPTTLSPWGLALTTRALYLAREDHALRRTPHCPP